MHYSSVGGKERHVQIIHSLHWQMRFRRFNWWRIVLQCFCLRGRLDTSLLFNGRVLSGLHLLQAVERTRMLDSERGEHRWKAIYNNSWRIIYFYMVDLLSWCVPLCRASCAPILGTFSFKTSCGG